MKSSLKELFAALGLIAMLILLLDPMSLYYSNMTLAMYLVFLVVFYIVFALFIVKDKPADEREESLQRFASRVAFMLGTGTLLLGVVVQSLTHSIDPWLVITLIVMISAKLLATKYGQRNC